MYLHHFITIKVEIFYEVLSKHMSSTMLNKMTHSYTKFLFCFLPYAVCVLIKKYLNSFFVNSYNNLYNGLPKLTN